MTVLCIVPFRHSTPPDMPEHVVQLGTFPALWLLGIRLLARRLYLGQFA